MADCVHIGCRDLVSCRHGTKTALNQEVGICEYCEMGCVFVPGPEPLWVLGNHRAGDQVTCRRSPDGKHWVRR